MEKRRAIGFLLGIFYILSVLLALPSHAESAKWWPENIRVGVFDYGDLFFDEENEINGYGIDYLNELAGYTGWQYEYIRGTWQELLDGLNTGKIDLLFPGQKTEERTQLVDYSKYDCGVEYTALFVPEHRADIYYGDIQSFQNLRIAMMSGSYQNDVFADYAVENNITYTPVFFDDWSQADIAMDNNKIDARISGSLHTDDHEKVVLKISPEPYFFMSNKNKPQIKTAIDKAMSDIQAWDPGFHIRIGEENSAVNVGYAAMTRAEADYVKQRGKLRVAYNSNWTPMIYRNNQSADGILYELLRGISKQSGLDFEYVPANSLEDMERMLERGEVDLLGYYPQTRKQKMRPEYLVLSKSYINVALSIVTSKTFNQTVKTVAIPKGQIDLARISSELYSNVEVKYYKDVYSCIQAVSRGSADIVLESSYILSQLSETYRNLNVAMPSTIDYPLHIAISTSEDPVILSILNKSIAHITSDDISRAVVSHSTQVVNSHYLLHFFQRYWLIFVAVILLIVFLLVLKWKKSLEHHAYMDPLTGCMNQPKFVMDLERRTRERYNGKYAVVCFDIDRFKLINDMYGFRSGNQVLQDIVKVLKSYLTRDEFFCRSSGDNFIMLLVNSDLLEVRVGFLVERICDTSRETENIRFNVSAGIYEMNEKIDSVHIAIDRANLARQTAKKEYYKIIFYNEKMRNEVLRKQELENRLDFALENNEFCVYFQPKYAVDTGNVVGAEALVRWIPEDGGMIFPDEFIPVFENNGTIVKLDLYVFRQVCANIEKWCCAGIAPYPVSVNLSRVHLYQEDFYKEYLAILRLYNVPSYLVELELTESTIFENQQQLVLVMERLKEQGLLISMDDFGSGYSSLNLLKDLPIDSLKIDREFFNSSANDKRGKMIIKSIVAMAQQLDILVVSEGVETIEQVEFLKEIHCHIAQGYYYARPLPLIEYERIAFGAPVP